MTPDERRRYERLQNVASGMAAGVGIVLAADHGALKGFAAYVVALFVGYLLAAAWCAWRDTR